MRLTGPKPCLGETKGLSGYFLGPFGGFFRFGFFGFLGGLFGFGFLGLPIRIRRGFVRGSSGANHVFPGI